MNSDAMFWDATSGDAQVESVVVPAVTASFRTWTTSGEELSHRFANWRASIREPRPAASAMT